MVDDVSSEESRSIAENSPPTLSNQIGWVTFDEGDNEDTICDNCIPEKKISEGNERYISRLGEVKVLQNMTLNFYSDPARCILMFEKKKANIMLIFLKT